MYLRELKLRNLRCFQELHLTFPAPRENGNWCVILGENGLGKSTILKAIALALLSDRTAARLVPNPAAWLHGGVDRGECEAVLDGQYHLSATYAVSYIVKAPGRAPSGRPSEEATLFHTKPFLPEYEAEYDLSVVAGYGPFRRPEPGGRSARLPQREEAFLNLFDDTTGIRNVEDWLQDLDYATKDPTAFSDQQRAAYENQLNTLKEIIDGLWPEESTVRLEVSGRGVFFIGPQNQRLTLADMSDGYRTIFALACDLLRHAVRAVDSNLALPLTKEALLQVSGIVLIDEVDAHLHPKWQREIGFRLQQIFPRIQFIVATHSPFVAQAATPGGIIVLDRDPKTGEVIADTSLSSFRGVPAEDILQSRAFDLDTTQELLTEQKMARHAHLHAQQQAGKLDREDASELARLDTELQGLLRNREEDDDALLRLEKLLREAKGKHD